MSVQLDPPHTLGFRRPLTQLVKRSLNVKNTNTQPVAFKVKTTAPKLYCVRPNSGRIEPGESVEVQVMLQAMKEEPALSAKCKDKFLIQSTFITPAKESLPLHEIWNSTDDSSEESKVHQQKVKVAYLAAEGTIDEEDELAANHSSFMAQDGNYATVKPHPDGLNGHAAPAIPQFDQSEILDRVGTPEEHHDAPETSRVPTPQPPPRQPSPQPSPQFVRQPSPQPSPQQVPIHVPPVTVNVHAPPPPMPVPEPAPAPTPAVAVPLVPSVSVDEHEELRGRFEEAQAELQRMRALLQVMPDPSRPPADDESESGTTALRGDPTVGPSELRRRNRALSDSRSDVSSTVNDGSTYVGTSVSRSTGYSTDDLKFEVPEGVPLQVVIMIALGVFVSTYLFF